MFINYRNDIEQLGYRVMATTTFEDGVSYDAHRIIGKRKLIRGDKMATPDQAMIALLARCEIDYRGA